MNETARTFECPSCGASLQPPSGAATMNCAYCGTSVVIPEDLRAGVPANPVGNAPVNLDLGQLIAEAVRMGQVVRLARGDLRSEAVQLYRENTGVDATQAEKVIEALITGHTPNPAQVGNEIAAVGEAITAMRTTREMDDRARRSRRSGGIGCSGIFAFLIIVGVILIAVYNSTGTAHDLLIRLIAQVNASGLFH
jgi:LSD1 subclass zinc finger protein